MEKVTTINLAGAAYQLEEPGYEALSRYLSDAKHKLAGNPDQQEILSDLESAIGQKCAARLTAHKSVLALADVEDILQEMGPVAGEANEAPKAEGAQAGTPPKRLYQIREGAWISGVCTGLAAYFNVDVILVRIAFAALAIVTSGGFILAYVVMMLVIPHAQTPQEQAQAHGVPPITARLIMERAQEGYDRFKNSGEWHRWKHQMAQQRREWKRQRNAWKSAQAHAAKQAQPRSPFWEFMQGVLGLVWFLVLVTLGYWSYEHIPAFRDLINNLPHYWQLSVDWLSTLIAEHNN